MSGPATGLDLLGAAAVVADQEGPSPDVVRLVRRGLPVTAVESLLDSGRLTLNELDPVVLARRTFAHRRKLGTLTPEQSDQLMRVARVLAIVEETFSSRVPSFPRISAS